MAKMRTGRKDGDDPRYRDSKKKRVSNEAEATQAGGTASTRMQSNASAEQRKAEIAALNKKYRTGEISYQEMKSKTSEIRTEKEKKQIAKQAGHSSGYSGTSPFQGAAKGSMLCAPSGGSCSPKKNKTLGGKF
jgi:hypothetical protein